MSMQFGTIAPSKPVKFENIGAGSVIILHSVRGVVEDFEATVLEMRKEFGMDQIPALIVRVEDQDEPQMFLANGQWTATVVTSSDVYKAAPESLLTLTPKPVEVHALQFRGGVESASEIVRWGAGGAHISWHPADAHTVEHLSIAMLEGDQRVNIGDYVIQGADEKYRVATRDEVLVTYDVEE